MSSISGAANVGGILGSNSSSSISMSRNYVVVTGTFDGAGTDTVGGLVGNLSTTGGIISIEYSFVDVSQPGLPLDATFNAVAGGPSGPAGTSFSNIAIISPNVGWLTATRSQIGTTTPTATTAVEVLSHAELATDTNLNFETTSNDQYRFTYDAAGKLRLGWEVNGFTYY